MSEARRRGSQSGARALERHDDRDGELVVV